VIVGLVSISRLSGLSIFGGPARARAAARGVA
jgi:hypothetical protein